MKFVISSNLEYLTLVDSSLSTDEVSTEHLRNWIAKILLHSNVSSISNDEPAGLNNIGETMKDAEEKRTKENKIINHQIDASEFARNGKELEVQEEIQA